MTEFITFGDKDVVNVSLTTDNDKERNLQARKRDITEMVQQAKEQYDERVAITAKKYKRDYDVMERDEDGELLTKEALKQKDMKMLKGIGNKDAKRDLVHQQSLTRTAIESLARAEILLPSEQGGFEYDGDNSIDRTWRMKQKDLTSLLTEEQKKKAFDLNLNQFAPYTGAYSRNGRHLLLGGSKGHLAVFNWQSLSLISEIHVNEAVRDVTFLHDFSMYAAAQNKYVYLYDNNGVELHCLRNHMDVTRMQFLPYHFLLSTINRTGYLKYQDTSTGQIVSEIRTKLGSCDVMKQNKHNATMCLGHRNGVVTVWSPHMTTPLVKMKIHRAPVQALEVDVEGKYLVTSGLDGQVKIYDIRTYKELHSYFTVRPATSIAISDTGLLGLGFGPHIQIWKEAFVRKQKSPFMVHQLPKSTVQSMQFCPFEDVLGVGHSKGFSSLIIPGAGESNFDSFENNPFQNKKQRQETLVHTLLDKIPSTMISLDNNLYKVMNKEGHSMYQGQRKAMREQQQEEKLQETLSKNKMRGKNKSSKRALKKQVNVKSAKKEALRQQIREQEDKAKEDKKARDRAAKDLPRSEALDRFR